MQQLMLIILYVVEEAQSILKVNGLITGGRKVTHRLGCYLKRLQRCH
jgi:hypothetical protein